MARPGNDERNADAAFERGAFAAAQGRIARTVHGRFGHDRAAVVGNEADECVRFLTGVGERLADVADGFIHGEQHGGVGAAFFILDVRELRQPIRRGLHRRMDRVEGQVEKPRLFSVTLNERTRLAAERVGGVIHRLAPADRRVE